MNICAAGENRAVWPAAGTENKTNKQKKKGGGGVFPFVLRPQELNIEKKAVFNFFVLLVLCKRIQGNAS